MIRPPEASRFGGDIAIELDERGTIRVARFGRAFSPRLVEGVDEWDGVDWIDTVSNETRAKALQLLAEASDHGVTGFREIQQTLPDGSSCAVEYAAIHRSGAGTILVGRDLRPAEELHRRFMEVQQTLERDYWKLRQVETRYRMIFRDAPEAGLVVAPDDLVILDANPSALRMLGLAEAGRVSSLIGRSLLADVDPTDRTRLRRYVRMVVAGGAAPIRVSVGPGPSHVLVRASMARQESGVSVVVRLTPVEDDELSSPEPPSAELAALLESLPDGFVMVDPTGRVLWANRGFAELVQAPRLGLVGRELGDWFHRVGADWDAVHMALEAHGTVRSLRSGLIGDLGREVEVGLSAVTAAPGEGAVAGIVVRDLG